MSTKTTLKRIALVAVSALGFGVLTSVAPASATRTATGNNISSITMVGDYAPVAAAGGSSTLYTITFNSNTTNTSLIIDPYVRLVSAPAASGMDQTDVADQTAGTAITMGKWGVASAVGAHTPLTRTIATTFTDIVLGTTELTLSGTQTNSTNAKGTMYLHTWYDVPGTYVWSVFDDTNGNGIVDSVDFSQNFTVVVAGGSASTAAAVTLTAIGGSTSTAKSGSHGALVKVTLKDSAGNPIQPDSASGVKLTVTGSAVIAKINDVATSGDPQTYVLGASSFDGDGNAWVNITDGTAETVQLTVSNSGFSSMSLPAAMPITFRTITALSTTATKYTTGSNVVVNTANSAYGYNRAAGSKTLTFILGSVAAASTDYDKVVITDTDGGISGLDNADYDRAVARTSSTVAGTFTVVTTGTGTDAFSMTINSTAGATVTAEAATNYLLTVENGDSRRAAQGAVNEFVVLLEDQFGNPRAAQTVTASIAGRNSTVVIAAAATDADGYATLKYTDASTSTTSLVDTITFSATDTVTATVTYTGSSDLGVSTVLLTTPHTTSTGVTEQIMTYSDIDAGADGAQATPISVTATVKDANSVAIVGVPVTFTISGTGAAVLSTKKTVYTGTTGTATASVYGWLAGTYTVTATAGGKSDDAPVNFAQVTADGTEARNITATVSGNVVTAKVTDRFGNPVYDAPVVATRTGSGSFNGVSSASGDTNRNGLVEFIVSGGSAEVTVSVGTTSNYGQTAASATLVSSNNALDVFEDYVAGTSLEAEEGVGNNVASYTAAGNNSAKVTVTYVDSAATAAEAAADAAAEAIDAANAATDAANLAAEAADAATVAAEEARDAADAATAAVEELATQVATLMAALKAQITTLANTVAKIAKKVKA